MGFQGIASRRAQAGEVLPHRGLGAGDADADGDRGDAEFGAELVAGAAVDVGGEQERAVGFG
jgi:hypothetical protein